MRNVQRLLAETWFVWKFVGRDVDLEPRLFTPHTDPKVYEHPFNFLWKTEEEAFEALKEFGHEKEAANNEWILCQVTFVPVAQMLPVDDDDDEECSDCGEGDECDCELICLACTIKYGTNVFESGCVCDD